MSVPNQGPHQLFLYEHGHPHWSQGGPLFYDRRMPPPVQGSHGPVGQNNVGNSFHSQSMQGAAPSQQWMRGPILGSGPHGPASCHSGQQDPAHVQSLGLNLPWNVHLSNQPSHRHGNRSAHYRHPRHNNGRCGGVGVSGVGRSDNCDGRYLCCKCGDYLQNSREAGVHLCDAVAAESRQSLLNSVRALSQEDISNNIATLLQHVKDKCAEAFGDQSLPFSDALQSYFAQQVAELAALRAAALAENSRHEQQLLQLKERLTAVEQREMLLQQQEELLAKDRLLFVEECKTERAELARQWQQLRDEITRMEELTDVQKGRVKLDVGGHLFTTSQLTLTRESDSMLAAMFSGRHGLKKEDDGTIFIDRDGTHFRYILNYLRDGGLSTEALPRNKQTLRELRCEAVYFQLHGLVQYIEKVL